MSQPLACVGASRISRTFESFLPRDVLVLWHLIVDSVGRSSSLAGHRFQRVLLPFDCPLQPRIDKGPVLFTFVARSLIGLIAEPGILSQLEP